MLILIPALRVVRLVKRHKCRAPAAMNRIDPVKMSERGYSVPFAPRAAPFHFRCENFMVRSSA
jgi:hypothetical protein